jgi:anti-anti-sigma regulatory factor/PAS domain-containing protein
MERHTALAPERRLPNDLAASDIAVVVLGTDGLMLYVSEGFCRLVGKPREELIGARAAEAEIASSAERTRWILDRAPEVGSAMTYRRVYETDSGPKLVDVHMHRAGEDLLVVTMIEVANDGSDAADSMLGSFLDAVPLGVVIYDRDMRIERVNRIVEELGRVRPEHVGRHLREAFPDVDAAVPRAIDQVLATGEEIVNLPLTRPDRHSLLLNFFPIRAPSGLVEHVGCLFSDVTDFTEAHEMIRAQREQIRELATPILEVEDRVLVAPLIGTLDARRLHDLTDRLLTEITRLRARVAILDVTGVPVIDSHAAHDLMNTAAAARLMGTEVVMSGISTEHAEAITRLGVAIGQIETVATLADAVAFARAAHS